MYRLTINKNPYGKRYKSQWEVVKAWVRMTDCIQGIGWMKVQ